MNIKSIILATHYNNIIIIHFAPNLTFLHERPRGLKLKSIMLMYSISIFFLLIYSLHVLQ